MFIVVNVVYFKFVSWVDYNFLYGINVGDDVVKFILYNKFWCDEIKYVVKEYDWVIFEFIIFFFFSIKLLEMGVSVLL